jgi:hsp70-interacting protein
MEALFGKSEPEKMKLLLNVIRQPESTSAMRTEALEGLEDYVEQIDNANDLDKMGGVELILRVCVNAAEGAERVAGVSVLAAVMRNNPQGQASVAARGGGAVLIARLRVEEDPRVLAKVVGALGALIQGQRNMLEMLHRSGALALMAAILRASDDARTAARIRVAHLVGVLLCDPVTHSTLEDVGLVGALLMYACGGGGDLGQLLDCK